MRPITVYRHCLASGLQIELDATRRGLLIFGPPDARAKRMPLIRRNGSELVELLLIADRIASAAIARAKHPRTVKQQLIDRVANYRRKATR